MSRELKGEIATTSNGCGPRNANANVQEQGIIMRKSNICMYACMDEGMIFGIHCSLPLSLSLCILFFTLLTCAGCYGLGLSQLQKLFANLIRCG